MPTKNISAFSVREIVNQQQLIPFRTSQIAASNNYVSGNGGTYTFHASGFINRANVLEFIYSGNGTTPTNFDVELYMTSSCTSNQIQYYYTGVNTREVDTQLFYKPIVDNDATQCLHGKIINNAISGMYMNYIEVRYNRLLEVS